MACSISSFAVVQRMLLSVAPNRAADMVATNSPAEWE